MTVDLAISESVKADEIMITIMDVYNNEFYVEKQISGRRIVIRVLIKLLSNLIILNPISHFVRVLVFSFFNKLSGVFI